MLGAFLQQTAPNGLRWADYCAQAFPSTDQQGLVNGRWGECMHHAVLFEMQNPGWPGMPGYSPDDGPAGQVLNYMEERGHAAFVSALEHNEEATRQRIQNGDTSYAFHSVVTFGQPAMGQPLAGQVIQGSPIPHHPGAPGSQVVVGIPITQRAEEAIQAGGLPEKASPEQIRAGAHVLDENPLMPEKRPYRDVPFAICFLVVVLILAGVLGAFVGEIPKLISRAGTQWESFPGKSCGMKVMEKWPDGESTEVAGIQQRVKEESDNTDTSSSSRRLHAFSDDLLSGDTVAFNELLGGPVLELPGLSPFVRRLELLGLAPSTQTEGGYEDDDSTDDAVDRPPLDGRRLITSTRRRRRTASTTEVVNRDCERACAAFEECGGFDVVVSSMQTKCFYQEAPSGSMPDPIPSTYSTTACWRKVDADIISKAAAAFMVTCFVLSLAGGCFSLGTAFGFVKLAAVKPATATYCGVYFVPGCMIIVGLACMAFLFPFIGLAAIVFGAFFTCCGGCMCYCTWCCYRDLIPLTIEVIATVTSIMVRYWSMLWVSACGAVAGVLWSFLCSATVLAVHGWYTRTMATTPASQIEVDSKIENIPYFVFMVIYFWGGYVAFNTCHVAFAGVFGSWYFGKDNSSTVCKSFKTAVTTAFGSICLGSLIIAVIRAMEELMKKMKKDAEEEGNTAVQIIACVLQCIIGCIGDILEWISTYVFVQVAVRGVGFCAGAQATYALATISNLIYVVSAILVGWVVGLGSMLCGLSGAAFAGAIGYFTCGVPGFCLYVAIMGALFGCLSGLMAGGSAVGVMNSGATTILMCWAERPDILAKTNPTIHHRFEEKIAHVRDSE